MNSSKLEYDTIIGQIELFSNTIPDSNAFVWLNDHGNEESTITYKNLWKSIRIISHFLLNELSLKKGDRIILCYTPGIDFIYSFYGCLASGIVAIPVYPADPNNPSQVDRLRKIVDTSQANACLTNSSYNRIISLFKFKFFNEPLWNVISWYSTDKILRDYNEFEVVTDNDLYISKNDTSIPFKTILKNEIIHFKKPKCEPYDSAFIQFTSGSTGNPKGVIVTHGSLYYNSLLCMKCFNLSPEPKYESPEKKLTENDIETNDEADIILKEIIEIKDQFIKSFGHNIRGFSWLPMYHDMGLVGFIVSTVIIGSETFLLSPFSFIKNPHLWLKIISKYRIAATAAPNFAFDYICRKITNEELEEINNLGGLGCLKHGGILSGSEPIRAATLVRFVKKFSSVGFCSSTFLPAYGMAENTLIISGLKKESKLFPKVLTLKSDKIIPGKKIEIVNHEFIPCYCNHCKHENSIEFNDKDYMKSNLVCCGEKNSVNDKIIIVCPEKNTILPENHVGEIWVSSKSKGAGYWLLNDLTDEIFFAKVKECDPSLSDIKFLRTGDLGFINDNQLYIVGRQKDVIIIKGKNYYPQDIEEVIDTCHEVIRPGCCVAFSIDIDGEEKLAIATEVRSEFIETSNTPIIKSYIKGLINKKEKFKVEDIIDKLSISIRKYLGIEAYRIILIKEKKMPKTSSGKVQRSKIRQMIMNGDFGTNILIDFINNHLENTQLDEKLEDQANIDSDYFSVCSENELPEKIYERVKNVFESVLGNKYFPELDDPLLSCGIESMKAVEICNALSKEFKIDFPATLVFDFPTLRLLIEHIDLLTNGNKEYLPNEITSVPGNATGDFVISGINAHLPGFSSNNPFAKLWKIMINNLNVFSPVPHERWDTYCFNEKKSVSTILKTKNYYTDIGAYIIGSEFFDIERFKILPIEVEYMDPQQRLLLRGTEKILRNVKLPTNNLIGVYIGCCSNDWSQIISDSTHLSVYSGTGASPSILANRISFYNGFTGPSITIDTACSSSLVALDIALHHLQQNITNTALVAGVNSILNPNIFVSLCKAKMLSETGKCSPFDENSNGYVRGEGCIILCIQHISTAKRKIATILGTYVNQDGKTSTLTAPKGPSQVSAIRNCLGIARAHPSSINYIECHGTGTPLGDPIEAGALISVFKAGEKYQYNRARMNSNLVIGAIKSNIGHLEGAAGLAGILKVLLVMSKRFFPGIGNLININTHIKKLLNKEINNNKIIFPNMNEGKYFSEVGVEETQVLRCGISSFGFGGTNSHVIIEEGANVDLIWDIETEEHSDLQEGNYFPWTARFHPFISTINNKDENYSYAISKLKCKKYVKEHIINGLSIFPASGYIELAIITSRLAALDISSTEQIVYIHKTNSRDEIINEFKKNNFDILTRESNIYLIKTSPMIINNLEIFSAFNIDNLENEGLNVSININEGKVSIYSENKNYFNCTVKIILDSESNDRMEILDSSFTLCEFKKSCLLRTIIHDELYDLLSNSGYNYMGRYRSLEYVSIGDSIGFGKIKTNKHDSSPFCIAPWILDSAFQVLGGFLIVKGNINGQFIPVRIEKMLINSDISYSELYSLVKITNIEEKQVVCNICLTNEKGSKLIEIVKMSFIKNEVSNRKKTLNLDDSLQIDHSKSKIKYESNDFGIKLDWRPVAASELFENNDTAFSYSIITSDKQFSRINSSLEGTGNKIIKFNKNFINLDGNVVFFNCKLEEILISITQAKSGSRFYILTKNTVPIEKIIRIDHFSFDNLYWDSINEFIIENNVIISVIDIESYNELNSQIKFGINYLGKNNIKNKIPNIMFDHLVIRNVQMARERNLTLIGYSATPIKIGNCIGMDNFKYELSSRGELKNFKIKYLERFNIQELGDNEVKVQVKAVGLNFRDVLNIMNLYPGDPGEPGSDFSGIIIGVGNNVKSFDIGDHVWGFAKGCFKSQLVTISTLISKKPRNLAFEEAAALPVIFCTVEASFNDLYKVKKGDFVLIHAATGGVGIAGVQYCINKGAIVFATCSSKTKKKWLGGLGVNYVSSSRDPQVFNKEMSIFLNIASKRYRGGKNAEFDLVLNCLSGEFIHESFKKIRPGGTFIELGKRGTLEYLQAKSNYPEINYLKLAIDELVVNNPKYIQSLLSRFETNHLNNTNPTMPVKAFKMESCTLEALRFMQKASHIGKIVLTLPPPQTLMFEAFNYKALNIDNLKKFSIDLFENYECSELVDLLDQQSRSFGLGKDCESGFIYEIITKGNIVGPFEIFSKYKDILEPLFSVSQSVPLSVIKYTINNEIFEELRILVIFPIFPEILLDGILSLKSGKLVYLTIYDENNKEKCYKVGNNIVNYVNNINHLSAEQFDFTIVTSTFFGKLAFISLMESVKLILKKGGSLFVINPFGEGLTSNVIKQQYCSYISRVIVPIKFEVEHNIESLIDEFKLISSDKSKTVKFYCFEANYWDSEFVKQNNIDDSEFKNNYHIIFSHKEDEISLFAATKILNEAGAENFVYISMEKITINYPFKYKFEVGKKNFVQNLKRILITNGIDKISGITCLPLNHLKCEEISDILWDIHSTSFISNASIQYFLLCSCNGKNNIILETFCRYRRNIGLPGQVAFWNYNSEEVSNFNHGSFVQAAIKLSIVNNSACIYKPIKNQIKNNQALEIANKIVIDKQNITNTIVNTINDIAGIEKIDFDTPLIELGLDSLSAVEVRNAISNKLNIILPITTLFDYPTINLLSDYILSISSASTNFLLSKINTDNIGLILSQNIPSLKQMIFSQNKAKNQKLRLSITGIGCRLPGNTRSPIEFWEKTLLSMQTWSCEVPLSRFDIDEFYLDIENYKNINYLSKNLTYSRHGTFIEGVDLFDNDYFNITTYESSTMDPQQRILLETTSDALHSSGYNPKDISNFNIGVFVGCCGTDWNYLSTKLNMTATSFTATGAAASIISNRLSFIYGIKGPSITIDTACSSSLVALDIAKKDINFGNIETAIVAANMLSPSGKCRAFDDLSDGFLRGEGCISLIIEKDSKSVGKKTYGRICGTAVNQDGKSASLTAPNGPSQRRVIINAIEDSCISNNDIFYIESHGTGTPLGDPIEFGAISDVFNNRANKLYIGTLKPNIGHLEGASGVAGILKAILVVNNGVIPPNILINKLNPGLRFDDSNTNILFPTNKVEINSKGLIAGVSSFGFGGTNSHVILQAGNDISIWELPRVDFKRKKFPWISPAHPYIGPKISGPDNLSHPSELGLIIDQISDITGVKKSNSNITRYVRNIGRNVFSSIVGHVIQGKIIFPGSAFIEMSIGGFINYSIRSGIKDISSLTISNIQFIKPLIFPSEFECNGQGKLICDISPYENDTTALNVSISTSGIEIGIDEIIYHSTSTVEINKFDEISVFSDDEISNFDKCSNFNFEQFYSELNRMGLNYSGKYKSIRKIYKNETGIFGVIEIDSLNLEIDTFFLHPSLLDGCFQLFALFVENDANKINKPFVPVSIEGIVFKPIFSRNKHIIPYKPSTNLKFIRPIYKLFACVKNKKILNNKEIKVDINIYIKDEETSELIKFFEIKSLHFRELIPLKTLDHLPIKDHYSWVSIYRELEYKSDDIEELDKIQLLFTSSEVNKLSFGQFDYFENNKMLNMIKENIFSSSTIPVYIANTSEKNSYKELISIQKTLQNIYKNVDSYGKLTIIFVTIGANLLCGEYTKTSHFQSSILAYLRSANNEFNQLGKISLIVLDWNSISKLIINQNFCKILKLIYYNIVNKKWLEKEYQLLEYNNEIKIKTIKIKESTNPYNNYMALKLTNRGAISNISTNLQKFRVVPTEGEVEIRVRSIGLNFRDVLNVMGLYPGDPGKPGSDFSGTVVSVGSGVKNIQVGDDVFGLSQGCIETYHTTNALLVVKKPKSLTFEEAASIPTIFSTAKVSLNQYSKLIKGNCVLIHVASGGVGLAAIQICSRIGANIIATVGNIKKIEYLKSIGIKFISSSRDHVKFSQDMKYFMSKLNIDGVDVVINSLLGEFIPLSMKFLKPNGTFIELGKREILNENQVKEIRADINYHTVEFDKLVENDAIWFQNLLHEIMTDIIEGRIQPIPTKVFSIQDKSGIIDGFRYIQHANHIGKVVLSNPSTAICSNNNDAYIITGGMGSLGLVIANWLVGEGTKNIILVGRSSIDFQNEFASKLLKLNEQKKINLEMIKCNICDLFSLFNIINKIKTKYNIRAIIHAAAVLNDGNILSQTDSTFLSTFLPKSIGAWNIHYATTSLLEYIPLLIMFSSISTLIGNIGQTNYSAANSNIEYLSELRSHLGMKSISIQWGPWAEQGMAKENINLAMLKAIGLAPIKNSLGLISLGGIISKFMLNEVNKYVVQPLDPLVVKNNTLSHIFSEIKSEVQEKINRHLFSTMNSEQLHIFVLSNVKQAISDAVGIDVNLVDSELPFKDLGIDSLSAVELRNTLTSKFEINLPPTIIIDYPTISELCKYIEMMIIGNINIKEFESPNIKIYSNLEKNDIVVLGIGIRVPGDASSVFKFWKNMTSLATCISEIPYERWDVDKLFGDYNDKNATYYTRKGGFISIVDIFDYSKYQISKEEAIQMDPNQRVALDTCFSALSDAKIQIKDLSNTNVGVFAGMCNDEWAILSSKRNYCNAFSGTGNAKSIISNRISYVFGLKGPSITIDAACASSLIAIDQAIKSLKNKECNMAVAFGVQLNLSPNNFIVFSKAKMLSKNSECRSFDKDADGFVRGEGCGAIILSNNNTEIKKSWGRILGSSTNHSGRSISLTAPNGVAQQKVLSTALNIARQENNPDIKPGYIECHGTGTLLGDAVEFGAIKEVYKDMYKIIDGNIDSPLILSTIKPQIGHLEGAAGIIGFIRLLVVLSFGAVPSLINYKNMNPHIEIENLNIVFPNNSTWKLNKNVGGVSSFGFGGANCHILVEGIRQKNPLITENEKLIFMFTGQGSHYDNMGIEYYNSNEVFRKSIDKCSDSLDRFLNVPLKEVMFVEGAKKKVNIDIEIYNQLSIVSIEYAEIMVLRSIGIIPDIVFGHSLGEYLVAVTTGIMTIEVALEIIYQRGMIISKLGKKGIMVAVRRSEDQIKKAIHKFEDSLSQDQKLKVSLGLINAPKNCVISGEENQVMEVLELLGSSKSYKKLPVSHAFHSVMFSEISDSVHEEIKHKSLNKINKKIIAFSSILGLMVKDEMTNIRYWSNQLFKSVNFCSMIENLEDFITKNGLKVENIIEIGPTSLLIPLLKASSRGILKNAKFYSLMKKNSNINPNEFLENISSGVHSNINSKFSNENDLLRIDSHLKWDEISHPFLLKRIFSPIICSEKMAKDVKFVYVTPLTEKISKFFHGYKRHGVFVMPEMGLIEVISAAISDINSQISMIDNKFVSAEPIAPIFQLEKINFGTPWEFTSYRTEKERPTLTFTLDSHRNILITSTKGGHINKDLKNYSKHHLDAKLNFYPLDGKKELIKFPLETLDNSEALSFEKIYGSIIEESFPVINPSKCIKKIVIQENESFSLLKLNFNTEIDLEPSGINMGLFYSIDRFMNIHPMILESSLHTIILTAMKNNNQNFDIYSPTKIGLFNISCIDFKSNVYVHSILKEQNEEYILGDILIYHENQFDFPIVEIRKIRLEKVNSKNKLFSIANEKYALLNEEWELQNNNKQNYYDKILVLGCSKTFDLIKENSFENVYFIENAENLLINLNSISLSNILIINTFFPSESNFETVGNDFELIKEIIISNNNFQKKQSNFITWWIITEGAVLFRCYRMINKSTLIWKKFKEIKEKMRDYCKVFMTDTDNINSIYNIISYQKTDECCYRNGAIYYLTLNCMQLINHKIFDLRKNKNHSIEIIMIENIIHESSKCCGKIIHSNNKNIL
ncbi:polyketide synthase, partial [Cryptosporidium sp. chipmunk genotype I]|uniref:polyketide synthase n=1 Tax=Cryptosporidium sp. chipmunk genotype I TaxID=1280935 RepID=UPI00351A81AF